MCVVGGAPTAPPDAVWRGSKSDDSVITFDHLILSQLNMTTNMRNLFQKENIHGRS
jgi:hypothetical protein